MARGSEGKIRRKNERKEARAKAAEEAVNEFDEQPAEEEDDGIPAMPGPPGSSGEHPPVEEDTSDEDAAAAKPKKKKKVPKIKKKSRALEQPPPSPAKGIKTAPLVLLILMTGTTVLPALLYAGDWFGAFLQKNHVLGSLGHRLGIGPSPKKRVLSFYEKHDPEKLNDVPNILGKYYGDYPKLIKRLERKYGDYGYFVGWEQDEAPITLAFEKLHETADVIQGQWNYYAPQPAKNAVRNAKYNLTTLYRKGRKIWKAKVWPHLEPIFGVPDGAAQQKRKDAQAAREQRGAGKRRKKNTEYRDDVED
mmetsp:Transcript_9980/g.13995  ORF Transcript_9980/g.13995 Transcript_9980/m.13995 type:complete len:306 (-) Transcript_9980:182-1099(-)|eukprot:CAMPEP_0185735340 /NCGR_PEP_ID=MMETSP1171-20130828/24980_1 /TAXON_ID=374046 /ORGANISM="Helicotheca tamensis, Strain CCMP826" /LENGTH=305 /DNA_ID=CAMNT_0028405607 /DNA_START=21 /DNA_END=938 /DNA_ORIENTATION=-